MTVYRISHATYADRLSSSGAANRWNRSYQFVMYTSESISLCALELLAHTSGIRPAGNFKIMEIDIENDTAFQAIDTKGLPAEWYMISSYSITQSIGSEWYDAKSSLVLKVPSAIINSEHNYVINTQHPDFNSKIRLKNVRDFFWDSRFPER